MGYRHGYITPPDFDAAKKLPINRIYVDPSFLSGSAHKGASLPTPPPPPPQPLALSEFLSTVQRTVVLGNPGAGKSTLSLKTCHELATRYSERLIGGRRLTPILVILRDYGGEKKTRSCSILQFVELTANSLYQVAPPARALEYLMLNGRVAVIFDGLDELLDTSYRQQVTADIESFCNLYPSVPVLVTSREVGYEQAPLDPTRFQTYHISPFDEKQVEDYVDKWFAHESALTLEQQRGKVAAFLEESRIVPDLRSNPLMLALMCNIYRGENYIPTNRPDVYEKCSVMLFERWDKSRGLLMPLPFEAHVRPAMQIPGTLDL